MNSLYAQYLEERTNDLIMEWPEGFVTYRYLDNGTTVYIVDIYTIPEMRRKEWAKDMADSVASEASARGCTELFGSVVPSMKNSTQSIKVLLGYGMSLHSAANDFIIFRKDI